MRGCFCQNVTPSRIEHTGVMTASKPVQNMHTLITGASGFVGSALKSFLEAQGHTVTVLRRIRRGQSPQPPCWDPDRQFIDLGPGPGPEAVVHLAGESIAGRWSSEKKRRIRDSRVQGTRLLCGALTRLPRVPQVLVCASATGFYGDRGATWLDEQSSAGTGFLAQVCQEWEAATTTAAQAGVRVVRLRLGLVLSLHGGALARMLPAFRVGLGGRIGSGQQFWSWIALDDLLRAVLHVLNRADLSGPANAVAPEPVTQAQFAAALGRALHRPTVLAMPAWLVRALLGEMAQATLLASARVRPTRLLDTGFSFAYPKLELALEHLLAKPE